METKRTEWLDSFSEGLHSHFLGLLNPDGMGKNRFAIGNLIGRLTGTSPTPFLDKSPNAMPFFNKLRKSNLQTDALQRYFLYAIGEIVLVVIGILIAMEINNWAQDRSERKQEQVILHNLLSDLEEEERLVRELISIERHYFEQAMAIFDHFGKHGRFTQLDTLATKLNSLYMRRTFNPVNTAFREMTSSGSFKLIQNDSLKRAILKYYHYQERIALIVSNNNARHVDENFVSSILDKTLIGKIDRLGLPVGPADKLRNEKLDAAKTADLQAESEKQLANPRNALILFNVLKVRANVASVHISQYQRLEKETRQLAGLLKKTLLESE